MAMLAGTVVIAADGTETTKTGFAGEYYDLLKANWVAAFGTLNLPVPTDPVQLAPARMAMAQAAIAQAHVITYIQANGWAKISTADGALQRAGGVDTTAPTVDKFLFIV